MLILIHSSVPKKWPTFSQLMSTFPQVTTHLPADDLDLKSVVELYVWVIHHHVDIDNSIHLIGRDKDRFVDTFHAVV